VKLFPAYETSIEETDPPVEPWDRLSLEERAKWIKAGTGYRKALEEEEKNPAGPCMIIREPLMWHRVVNADGVITYEATVFDTDDGDPVKARLLWENGVWVEHHDPEWCYNDDRSWARLERALQVLTEEFVAWERRTNQDRNLLDKAAEAIVDGVMDHFATKKPDILPETLQAQIWSKPTETDTRHSGQKWAPPPEPVDPVCGETMYRIDTETDHIEIVKDRPVTGVNANAARVIDQAEKLIDAHTMVAMDSRSDPLMESVFRAQFAALKGAVRAYRGADDAALDVRRTDGEEEGR
jgi:hypothetical protein